MPDRVQWTRLHSPHACRPHIPVQACRDFEAQGSIFDGRSQTMKVLAISQTRCAFAHMSLDDQAACGIEFSVHISVEKILGFPAGHKQFSAAVFRSTCGKTASLKAVNGFSSGNRFASATRHHCYKPHEAHFYFRTRQLFSRHLPLRARPQGHSRKTKRPTMNGFYSRGNLMVTRLVLLHENSKA